MTSGLRSDVRVAATLISVVVAAGAVGFLISRTGAHSQLPAPPTPLPTLPQAPVPSAPESSFGYSVAASPEGHQVLLFGGVDDYNDTWLWKGHAWTFAPSADAPPGRFGAAIAYDPMTHAIMLYGGRLAPGQVVDDTWAWNGKSWTKLDDGTGSPPPGEGGAMAWDEQHDEMVLLVPHVTPQGNGGETWMWTGAHWSRMRSGDLPAGTQPVAAAYDPQSRSLLAVGVRSVPANTYTLVTLQLRDGSWRELTPHRQPESFTGLALDPATNELLLASEPTVGGNSVEAWAWTGADWVLRGASQGPLEPDGAVTDPANGRVLLFGTATTATQGSPGLVHVWAWQRSAWMRVS